MSRWLEYKNSLKQDSIISKLTTANKEHIDKNRQYIKCLIDIVIFLDGRDFHLGVMVKMKML